MASAWHHDESKLLNPRHHDLHLKTSHHQQLHLKSAAIKGLLGDRVWSHLPVEDFSGEGKIVGLYFASGRSEECRRFTPQLINFYNQVRRFSSEEKEQQQQQKHLEIVFISCDPDAKSFEQTYKEMPWPALPLDDTDRERIMKKYHVKDIPALVFIDGAHGEELYLDGCRHVRDDPNGENFPKFWHKEIKH